MWREAMTGERAQEIDAKDQANPSRQAAAITQLSKVTM